MVTGLENNDFYNSISEISQNDLGNSPKKKVPLSSIARYLMLIICLAAFSVSMFFVIRSLVYYVKADDEYGDVEKLIDAGGLEPMFPSAECEVTPDYEQSQTIDPDSIKSHETRVIDREYEKKRNELAALRKKYPALYGWIKVPGTNINYPIVQGSNNTYYLTHSYTGAYLLAGAIFVDYRNDKYVLDNKNLVIYGHHMDANLMFHALDNYLKESFFKENNKIIIYTVDGKYTYEIVSVYNTDKYYNYIRTSFFSDSSFLSFAEEMISNSIHKSNRVPLATDYMITLSTCSNRARNGRLSVQGILIDVYE